MAAAAYGPVNGPNMGWVADFYKKTPPSVTDGALKVQGNSRLYLVQDMAQSQWPEHRYTRVDLHQHALTFTLDLSNVPCGCLACVYMVKMKDPSEMGSNYCGAPSTYAFVHTIRPAVRPPCPRVTVFLLRACAQTWRRMSRRKVSTTRCA